MTDPIELDRRSREHFVSGVSNNPLTPTYVPSLFKHVNNTGKHRLEAQMAKYERRAAARKG